MFFQLTSRQIYPFQFKSMNFCIAKLLKCEKLNTIESNQSIQNRTLISEHVYFTNILTIYLFLFISFIWEAYGFYFRKSNVCNQTTIWSKLYLTTWAHFLVKSISATSHPTKRTKHDIYHHMRDMIAIFFSFGYSVFNFIAYASCNHLSKSNYHL